MSFSAVVRSGYVLKCAGIALALVGLLALSGCWVSSINPLYDEGTVDHPHDDSDVVFDQSLMAPGLRPRANAQHC